MSFSCACFSRASKRTHTCTHCRWVPKPEDDSISARRSLRFLAVPVVTIFKNMTNIITLAGAWYLYGESASAGIVCSLLLCVAGAVMAGVSDVAPSVEGYVWMVLNCVCTAAFVLYMRAAVKMKLSVFEKAYYNNVLMLPMAASLALTLGEWPGAWQAEQWTWPAFSIAVAFSGAVGFFLNMASIWCVDMTGATTYAMVGALNKVPVTFIGYALFASPISSKQWFFIVLSLAGGLLYAYVKASEGRGGKAPAKSPPPLPTPDGPGDQEQATPSHSAP